MPKPSTPETTIGSGIHVRIDGDEITMRFSAAGAGTPSRSGKTMIVASTSGNVTLPNGITVGLNAYRKA